MRRADGVGAMTASSSMSSSSMSALMGQYPNLPGSGGSSGGSAPPQPPPPPLTRFPFESQYEYHVRKNRRMSVGSGMNRTASMDSTNSSISSTSFSDPMMGVAPYMLPSMLPLQT